MWKLKFTQKMIVEYAQATGLVLGMALAMFLVGRDALGEAVIGLLYLVPVGWSAARWGQWPGICAAVVAFLTFNFFFIPPYYTFVVGSLEGWLLLAIFLIVAVVIVGRIQSGLTQAQLREREAILLYELSTALIGLYTREAVARALAGFLQQLFQAAQVRVTSLPDHALPPLVAAIPPGDSSQTQPDRTIPVYSVAYGLIGEILMWRREDGPVLPMANERLLQTIATQGALALERARLAEMSQNLP